MRLFDLAFFGLTATALYQLVVSPPPSPLYYRIIAGIVFGILVVGFTLYLCYRLIRAERYELFGDTGVRYTLFPLYNSYRDSETWMWCALIAYRFVTAVVAGAITSSPWAQVIVLLVAESIYLGILIWRKPYEDHRANGITIASSVIRLIMVINKFCFLFPSF